MDQDVDVNPGYEKDYYRFFMKRGLNWDEIKEMLNYGVGIAFHDVMAENVNDVEEIKQHYGIAQSKIQEQLAGRRLIPVQSNREPGQSGAQQIVRRGTGKHKRRNTAATKSTREEPQSRPYRRAQHRQ